MMRRLTIICFLICGFSAVSQQLPQYSQYMLNEMAINPAVAGRDNFAEVRTNHRHQWIGIPDAPRTFMLTLQGPIEDKKMGLGMGIFTDIVGPTRRTGINFSYAYHLKVTEKYNVSMGLSAGLLQWGIDGTKITLHDEGDQHLINNYQTAMVPDFGAGVYFYEKNRFYLGISMPQMYQAPIVMYQQSGKDSRLASQLNLNGAYKFDIDENFAIEPSFLFKYEKPTPVKMDVGVRFIYKSEIWLGATYRHFDAVSALIGYMYKDYLLIGYSYDFSTTRIRNYSTGTHELMLGLRFSRKQASTWKTKTKE